MIGEMLTEIILMGFALVVDPEIAVVHKADMIQRMIEHANEHYHWWITETSFEDECEYNTEYEAFNYRITVRIIYWGLPKKVERILQNDGG